MNQITGVLLFLIGVISTDRTLHRNAKYHNECIKKRGECEGQKGFFFFLCFTGDREWKVLNLKSSSNRMIRVNKIKRPYDHTKNSYKKGQRLQQQNHIKLYQCLGAGMRKSSSCSEGSQWLHESRFIFKCMDWICILCLTEIKINNFIVIVTTAGTS